MLEQPGPPLNQVANGAVVGFVRASKLCQILGGILKIHQISGYVQPEPHVHVRAHGEVTRVLLHSRCRLANTRVGDELHLCTSSSVLEDSEIGAIALDERTFVVGS